MHGADLPQVASMNGLSMPADMAAAWQPTFRAGLIKVGPCPCCRFPSRKEENWWLIVGQPELNLCHIIKRQPLKQSAVNKLRFKAPSEPGQHELKLMFISDSYVGADQVCFTDPTRQCRRHSAAL